MQCLHLEISLKADTVQKYFTLRNAREGLLSDNIFYFKKSLLIIFDQGLNHLLLFSWEFYDDSCSFPKFTLDIYFPVV